MANSTCWGLILFEVLMVLLNVPFVVSLAIATIVPAILGGIVYRLIFRRIRAWVVGFSTASSLPWG